MNTHQNRLAPRHRALDTRHRRWSFRFGAFLLLGCGNLALSTHAQYAIDWHEVAGGGGTSTGSVYSVSGTIGQHDAGPTMTNAQFSVAGGFWLLPQAVQVEGAPTLTIAPAAPGFAKISWTPSTPGFLLQETWTLTPANWTNSVSASTNPITLPTDFTAKFFRLRKQP